MRDHIIILMAEADPDDLVLMREPFRETRFPGELRTVTGGAELLEYLYNRGKFEAKETAPLPDLILLDLNLPGLDGHEVLGQIKGDFTLRRIPVVVCHLAGSTKCYQIVESRREFVYHQTADSDDLVNIIGLFGKYWLVITELPP